jgi:hypothetical protein
MSLLVLSMFSSAAVADTWKQVTKKEGITVWQKTLPNNPFVAFRGELLMNASIKKVLAVLNDQDHKTAWMHQCTANYVVEHVKMGHLIIYNRTGSTFPFVADRDVVAETKLVVDQDNATINISAKNISHPKQALVDGVVRMQHMDLHWTLKFINKRQTMVTYQVLTDPGGWLPAWVVNLVAKGIPYWTLKGLAEQTKEPYEKSMAYLDASFDWSTVGL